MRVLVVMLIAFAGVFLTSAPAHAGDEVGLSNDGVTWGTTLARPLFDPSMRWIPGDSETASFYLRNQGPTSALLSVEVRSADADDLLENDDITLRARAAGGAWVELDNGRPTASLTRQSIGQGRVVRVDVNAKFDPASTNQSQTSQLRFAFDVTLHDALEGDGAGTDDDAPAGGLLPATGAPYSWWHLAAASLLITLGLALVRRSREEEEVTHG